MLNKICGASHSLYFPIAWNQERAEFTTHWTKRIKWISLKWLFFNKNEHLTCEKKDKLQNAPNFTSFVFYKLFFKKKKKSLPHNPNWSTLKCWGCFLHCWFSHLKLRYYLHNFNFKKQLISVKNQWSPCFSFIWAYTFCGHLLSKKVAKSNKRWENCKSDGVFHPLGGELMIKDSGKVSVG